MFKQGRCLCIGPGMKAVKMAEIEKASVIYPSNGCDKVEVMYVLEVTMVWVLLFG
jgi:C-X-C motif-containing chemokine 11